MPFRRLNELSREELENLIAKSNTSIQRLEGMKQEKRYENAIAGFDLQIQSHRENLELYKYHIENLKKH